VPYAVLDPLPRAGGDSPPFDAIADATGETILRESVSTGRCIQVLWSGGIDSTVALIALSKSATTHALRARIRVICSVHSVREYPWFFSNHVAGVFPVSMVTQPIGEALDDTCLIVTGEHGDQLFGSVKLESLVDTGDAALPYRSFVQPILARQFGNEERAAVITDYLAPQIEQCPTPLETVFDYLWWVNFSLKWQHVSLRIPVFRGRRPWRTYFALRHFFRRAPFQRWALRHPEIRRIENWRQYKLPAKEYIYAFTKDADYYENKVKEPSLKHVLVDSRDGDPPAYRIHWYLGQRPQFTRFTRKPAVTAPV
jgi:hypothetical protein